MIPYFDAVDRKWRIRHESGEVSDSKFSSEEDAQSAIELAFDHSMILLETESRYRRAAQRRQAKQAEVV